MVDDIERLLVHGGASSIVAHRRLLGGEDTFDTNIKHMADWDLWIRLTQHGPPAVIDDLLVAYRVHSGNASTETWSIPREIKVIEDRYRALRSGARIDRAYVYRWIAWNCLCSGRRRDALRAYMLAVANRDFASLGRAAVGLAYPGVAFRMRPLGDASWVAHAEAWLRPLAGK